MGYRIQLLAQFGVAAEEMTSKILGLCPDFPPENFANRQIFYSNERCSCLAVSKQSGICNHFDELATQSACVRIVTNDTDDWHLKLLNQNTLLADLHLPLVNVDSDEWCEPDGKEVRQSISCKLPDELSNQIMEMDTPGAWLNYFKYAERTIDECLTACEIQFDTSKLQKLFSEDSFGAVSKTVGAQLGFFVCEVLKIGLDFSPADEY